jgi:glycosyltransferase involved in cell wall biosynthesis
MKKASERLNGLRWRLTATRRLWSAGAEPQMTFLEPEPPGSRAIGEVDAPAEDARLSRGTNVVRGWIYFPAGPTARVEVWLGDALLGRARLGLPRPDVSETTERAHAEAAGFELAVNLADWNGPDAGELRVVATGTAGERLELEPVPVTVGTGSATSGAQLALPPLPLTTPPAPEREGRKVLVFTHQLDLGGAQLYLLELIGALLEAGAVNPTVVSAADGAVRERLEALGVPVHISGLVPIDDPSAHTGHVEELTAWATGRGFELAFVNTATAFAFPGAEVAARLGIPAVWSIHESFEPEVLWANLHPEVRRRAEEALREAALALFVAESTQRLYEDHVGAGRCLTAPYGFDFGPIEEARERLDHDALRRRHGIPADAEVLLCLGTVEPRKRQVPLAQAFDLIAADHPKAELVIVGARDDDYSRLVEHCIASGRSTDRMKLLPITPDVQQWLCVADILVCPSDIESLPRTVVEAMAWELPVLACDVFGLPELVGDGQTGWLCETRDISALARALERSLASTAEERRRMGEDARRLVLRRHSLPKYAEQVSRLLEDALAREPKGRVAAG